jgi:hypothetical protein
MRRNLDKVEAFKKKILKRVNGPEIGDVTDSGIQLGLYNDEVHNLYPLPNIIRAMK